MKFHVGKNGAAPCYATKRKCRYEEFGSLPQAESRYEEKQPHVHTEPGQKPTNVDSGFKDIRQDWLGSTEIDGQGYLTVESENLISPKGAFCEECSREITAREIATMLTYPSTVKCDCGEILAMDRGVEVRIEEGNLSYPALDKKNISKMTWYHSTFAGEEFAESINARDVPDFHAIHLGTKMASFDRGVTNSPLRGTSMSSEETDYEPFYLYEVKVDDDAFVQDEIEEDDNSEYKLTEEEDSPDVVRYYNLWEDTASISLAVNPKKVHVVSVRKVSREEAYSCPSPMNMKPIR